MASRTPLHGGPVVAMLWVLGQIVLWAVVVVSTALLSLVLVALCIGLLDPTNWKGAP